MSNTPKRCNMIRRCWIAFWHRFFPGLLSNIPWNIRWGLFGIPPTEHEFRLSEKYYKKPEAKEDDHTDHRPQ